MLQCFILIQDQVEIKINIFLASFHSQRSNKSKISDGLFFGIHSLISNVSAKIGG